MLARDMKRFGLFILPALVFLYLGFGLYHRSDALISTGGWAAPTNAAEQGQVEGPYYTLSFESGVSITDPEPEASATDISDDPESIQDPTIPHETVVAVLPPGEPEAPEQTPQTVLSLEDAVLHQEVFSTSTADKKFFLLDFGGVEATNPNIIPHPILDGTWVVVAQKLKGNENMIFEELICNAAFVDGALKCLEAPTLLPVAPTEGQKCSGVLDVLNTNVGPHDARVFVGPNATYIVYGSNSRLICFGQFVQDFYRVAGWVDPSQESLSVFQVGTELQRPPPWNDVEKNWFLFWDADGQAYAHYDVAPKRAFAQLSQDGSVGEDLAPQAAMSDERCMKKYMPEPQSDLESVHQATNSLQISWCERSDPTCTPSELNTFIFTIYQHKTFYNYHSVYEPYVMAFQQRAPFEIAAMSRQPLWIHGREKRPEGNTSDMFYVTSMSWKQKGQGYHGYLDDELFIAFGIEDERAGGIDVLAKDLLANMGLCSELNREGQE